MPPRPCLPSDVDNYQCGAPVSTKRSRGEPAARGDRARMSSCSSQVRGLFAGRTTGCTLHRTCRDPARRSAQNPRARLSHTRSQQGRRDAVLMRAADLSDGEGVADTTSRRHDGAARAGATVSAAALGSRRGVRTAGRSYPSQTLRNLPVSDARHFVITGIGGTGQSTLHYTPHCQVTPASFETSVHRARADHDGLREGGMRTVQHSLRHHRRRARLPRTPTESLPTECVSAQRIPASISAGRSTGTRTRTTHHAR